MDLYTLFLSVVLNHNKELPVQAGLTLDDCRAAALQALEGKHNFARCVPAQPLIGPAFIRVADGRIIETIRQPGIGYGLPRNLDVTSTRMIYAALGTPSSGVHSGGHVYGTAKAAKMQVAAK